jgi:hypothetical protein
MQTTTTQSVVPTAVSESSNVTAKNIIGLSGTDAKSMAMNLKVADFEGKVHDEEFLSKETLHAVGMISLIERLQQNLASISLDS